MSLKSRLKNCKSMFLLTSIQKEDVLSQIRNAIKSALKANIERQLIESCVQDVFNNYDSQREIARSKSN